MRQTLAVPVVRLLIGIVVVFGLTWVMFVAALILFKPKGINFAEAKRLVPDICRLLRSLAGDRDLPPSVHRRLALLLAYLALPFDMIPDFIPVVGYADDVTVVALVLRSVVRAAGPQAVDAHWTGTIQGRSLVHALAGIGRHQ
ncbi:MAG TPA: DUF1232 domain-containing protein [Acidimicrobiales bacterium]|nr:DUF1232 domain-containing protein [Acidimicrobiales bacterium]